MVSTAIYDLIIHGQDLNLDGVEELLAIASQHSIPLETGKSLSPPTAVNPVIVVEGMDAAGSQRRIISAFNFVR